MRGAVTEYQGNREGWRGLPFGAGSLTYSACSLLLSPQPMGLAVRASDLAERVENFRYRDARLCVEASGTGDIVAGARLNGRKLDGTLQLPESRLRPGPNRVEVRRGDSFDAPRLHSTTARLWDVRADGEGVIYELSCPFAGQLTFENLPEGGLEVSDADGNALQCKLETLPETNLTLVRVPAEGDFRVRLAAPR